MRAKNKKKSAAEQLVMNVERQKLTVDGTLYQKQIKPPSCKELLHPLVEQLGRQLQIEISEPETVEVEGQTFIGYTTAVRTMEEVNAAYAKVCGLNASARHVIRACALPGRSFPTNVDFHNDDEHGLGAEMLDILEGSDITNRAVFVARHYDGTHIGTKRIDAILDVTHKALLANSHNAVTGTHQHPLTKREIQDLRKNTLGGYSENAQETGRPRRVLKQDKPDDWYDRTNTDTDENHKDAEVANRDT